MALIGCPDCGTQVSESAPSCIKCGRPIRPSAPLPQQPAVIFQQAPPAKKSWGGIAALGCLGMCIFFMVVGQIGKAAREERGEVPGAVPVVRSKPAEEKQPEISVDADQLVADYVANEVAADARYKGKVLDVRGRVSRIGKSLMGTMFVTLHDQGFREVQASFDDEHAQDLGRLQVGQSVTIRGECGGLTGNVHLRNSCLAGGR